MDLSGYAARGGDAGKAPQISDLSRATKALGVLFSKSFSLLDG